MGWRTRHCSVPALLLFGLALWSLLGAKTPPATTALGTDEEVVLFATSARFAAGPPRWIVPVHAWVFEPEESSWWRRGSLGGVRKALGLERASERNTWFRSRALPFLSDNERGKTLRVEVGGARLRLPATGADGHAQGWVEVPASAGETVLDPLALRVHGEDGRVFRGSAYRVRPEGFLVVSDVDDTVKISNVNDHAELLRNTFLREFRAVPGLAVRYRAWADAGAHFEYLSASPWQLYVPLRGFLQRAGFPGGALHLKSFRLKDERFLALFDEPEATKLPVLEGLLAAYPKRHFVLVGDSGERDPEIYGDIARRHPTRVVAIFIRDVTASRMSAARAARAWDQVNPERVRVFRDASELPEALDSLRRVENGGPSTDRQARIGAN